MTNKLIWQPSFENGKNVNIVLDSAFVGEMLNKRPTKEAIVHFNNMGAANLISYLGSRKANLAIRPFDFYKDTGLVTRFSTEMVSGIKTTINPNTYVNVEADVDGLERIREGATDNLIYRSRGTEHPIQTLLLIRVFDYWVRNTALL